MIEAKEGEREKILIHTRRERKRINKKEHTFNVCFFFCIIRPLVYYD